MSAIKFGSADPARSSGPDPRGPPERWAGAGVGLILICALALTAAALPFYLVAALGVTLEREIGLTATMVGLAGSVLFSTSALTAALAGRLADRFGATRALRAGVVLATLASAILGGLATRPWHVLAAMVMVGMAVALVDTGAARAYARRIQARWQGRAFGVKEAAAPAAAMLAGVSLPTLASVMGWRATFLVALMIGVLSLLLIPAHLADGDEASMAASSTRRTAKPIRFGLFAAAVAFAAGAATGAVTFMVPTFVEAGWSERSSGILLALVSAGAIAMRMGIGFWADRDVSLRSLMASLLAIGAVGAAAVAAAPRYAGLAAVVTIPAAWGWPGLAFLTAVRAAPDRPAAAAGIALTGMAMGGASGPLLFGLLSTGLSFRSAWGVAAGAFTMATLLVLAADRSAGTCTARPNS